MKKIQTLSEKTCPQNLINNFLQNVNFGGTFA